MSLVEVQQLANLFSRGAIGSNPNGERIGYLAGERRSKEVTVFLNVALDNSGSMCCSCGHGQNRLEVALDCLQKIVYDKTLKLAKPDSLVVHTFNNEVVIRLCCHPDRYDHNKLINSINAKNPVGGATRMRDAIDDALKNMEKHGHETHREGKEVVRYLLVLTDGEDNSSTMTQDVLISRLNQAAKRLPNLHLVIIAAGMGDNAVAGLQQLCVCAVPVTVFNVAKADDVSIKAAFESAMEHLRALVFRNARGKVTAMTYVGRDSGRVQQMDMKAAEMIKSYKNTKVISGANDVKDLMAIMSGSSGQQGRRGRGSSRQGGRRSRSSSR